MKNRFKIILSLVLVAVLLFCACAFAGCNTKKAPPEGPSSEEPADGGPSPTLPEEPSDGNDGGDDDDGDGGDDTKPTLPAAVVKYYSSVTAASGNALLGQLHDLITTTHTHYSSYSECRDYAHTTDYAAGGEKSIIEFYTHETIIEYTKTGSDAGRWNREHVWPKSCSNNLWKGSNTVGGGADMHHIRPSEVEMNGTRGDDKYGEVANGSPVYSKTTSGANSEIGGYHRGGVFEPLDNVKGDVARIVFYVYTHYNTYSNVYGTTNGSTNGQTANYFGTLHFTDVVSASSETEAIELLLKWNADDPVDEIEQKRNEEVYKIQHNRNPFIDYGELADAVWGDGIFGP